MRCHLLLDMAAGALRVVHKPQPNMSDLQRTLTVPSTTTVSKIFSPEKCNDLSLLQGGRILLPSFASGSGERLLIYQQQMMSAHTPGGGSWPFLHYARKPMIGTCPECRGRETETNIRNDIRRP